MRRILIGLLMCLLCAGCGGGGGGEPLEPPAFDLTGYWMTTAIDCDAFSADVPPYDLVSFNADLEDDLLQAPGVRVVQRDNDLEITDVETGLRMDGMISGDQVRYVYSEQRSLGGLDVSIYVETEGTVLDAHTIAGTQAADWTLTVQGQTITGGALCTGRLTRAPPAKGDSTTPLEPSEFNATGLWQIAEPVDCSSSEFPSHQLEGMESELLGQLPVEIVQTGNTLELASFQTGRRSFGTISGDQVYFEYSESDSQYDFYGEGRGTAISPHRAAITETAEFVPTNGPRLVIRCSYHVVRA